MLLTGRLNVLKLSFWGFIYWKQTSFLRRVLNGELTLHKFGRNFSRYCIKPKNVRSSETFFGTGISSTAWIFSGSGWIDPFRCRYKTLVSNMALTKLALLRNKFQVVVKDTTHDGSKSVVILLYVFSQYKRSSIITSHFSRSLTITDFVRL